MIENVPENSIKDYTHNIYQYNSYHNFPLVCIQIRQGVIQQAIKLYTLDIIETTLALFDVYCHVVFIVMTHYLVLTKGLEAFKSQATIIKVLIMLVPRDMHYFILPAKKMYVCFAFERRGHY